VKRSHVADQVQRGNGLNTDFTNGLHLFLISGIHILMDSFVMSVQIKWMDIKFAEGARNSLQHGWLWMLLFHMSFHGGDCQLETTDVAFRFNVMLFLHVTGKEQRGHLFETKLAFDKTKSLFLRLDLFTLILSMSVAVAFTANFSFILRAATFW
jgi:hypothetical protein